MLPDEMLTRCLSFVGKGHYVFVGSVSKRFRQAYKDVFANEKEEEAYKTFYQSAASNASVAKYCFGNQSVTNKRKVREKILFHAATKGRVDVMKLAKHRDILGLWGTMPGSRMQSLSSRPKLHYYIEKIAEAGHMNILQCLKDDFDMHLGLYKASRGAALGGHLYILKWLKEIDCLREYEDEEDDDNLCHFAIRSGHVETVKWLKEQGIPLQKLDKYGDEPNTMDMAIWSRSIEMIAYCRDHGHGFGADDRNIRSHIYSAIGTNDIEVVMYCYENVSILLDPIPTIILRTANTDILKYFRSKSMPWHPTIIEDAAESNLFDLLKFAHKSGCKWSVNTWVKCLQQHGSINWEMMNYLYDNKCPWNPSFKLRNIQNAADKEKVLKFVVEKRLQWTGNLLLECINWHLFEETKKLMEITPNDKVPESLANVARRSACDLQTYQYLFRKGIPFLKGNDRKGFFSFVRCHKIIKWALDNDCPLSENCDFTLIAETVDFRQDIVELLLKKTSPRLDDWYMRTWQSTAFF